MGGQIKNEGGFEKFLGGQKPFRGGQKSFGGRPPVAESQRKVLSCGNHVIIFVNESMSKLIALCGRR